MAESVMQVLFSLVGFSDGFYSPHPPIRDHYAAFNCFAYLVES